MHRSWVGWMLAMAAALAGSPAAGATEAGSPGHAIRARFLAGGFVVVPVTVNGTGPHPFLLDTGGTSSMVDEALARELELPGAGRALQHLATGAASIGLVRARLRLGSVERDGEVICAPLVALRKVDPRIRGLIGQDLLRRSNWWLDYRRRLVVEDADGGLSAAVLGERVALHWHGDRPAIDASPPDRSAVRLVLDSAAASAVLFREAAGASERVGSAVLGTHDDQVLVPLVTVGPLRAGPVVIPRFTAGLMVGGGGRTEDGLLPTSLFEGIYFDNRAGTVVLNPERSVRVARR